MPYQIKPDEILLPSRRGDIVSSNLEYAGMRDGMASGYIDGAKYAPILSDNILKICSWAKISRAQLNAIKKDMDVGVDANGLKIPTKLGMDYDALAAKKLVSLADVREQKVSQPFDLTKTNLGEVTKDLTKVAFTLSPTVLDRLLIAAGSYTIGTAGSYPTFHGAAGFLPDWAATITGALTGTVISAITETTTGWIVGNVNGQTIKITSNNDHAGNPLAGHIISQNYAGFGFLGFACTGAGTVIIELLNYLYVNGSEATGRSIIYNGAGTFDLIIRKNLMRGAALMPSGISLNNPACPTKIYLNKIQNCKTNSIILAQLAPSSYVLNNTLHGSVYGFHFNNQRLVAAGNASYAASSADFYLHGNASCGINNMSDDATAADANWRQGFGNQINGTPATDLESVDPAAGATWLAPKTTGDLYGTGVMPPDSSITTYVNGTRIISAAPDIGAHGFEHGGPTFPATDEVDPLAGVYGWAGELTPNMDIPALSRVDPLGTLRGAAGTMDVPELANVSNVDSLRGVQGGLDASNVYPDTSDLESMEAVMAALLQGDATLAAFLTSYKSLPSVFSDLAPEGAETMYLVYTVTRVPNDNIPEATFNLYIDFYDRGASRENARGAAQRVEEILDQKIFDGTSFDKIRLFYASGGFVNDPKDPRSIHYNAQFTIRAGRKAWAATI